MQGNVYLKQFAAYIAHCRELDDDLFERFQASADSNALFSDWLAKQALLPYPDYAALLASFFELEMAELDQFNDTHFSSRVDPGSGLTLFFDQQNRAHIVFTEIEHWPAVEALLFRHEPAKAYVANKSEKNAKFEQISDSAVTELDKLFRYAVENAISDIHLEPFEQHMRIRLRINGLLSHYQELPLDLATKLISRLKVLANLNIAVSNQAQDGRISLKFAAASREARVSICPTMWGEKAVLRLLHDESQLFQLTQLGLEPEQLSLLQDKLNKAQGMILVTGPTGSGKSTTLYAALNQLNAEEKNIVSIEDPIEIKIYGINQVNINRAQGFDFAKALRAFLRQDPDIMMLGEMRDYETAELAVKAAQTGHLLLSSLHTNSAIDSLNRLYYMGIQPLNLIDSIHLVIAQRLLRKLCPYCKQALPKSASQPAAKLFQAKGCQHCHQGYNGRLAIFELLTPADIASSSTRPLANHQDLIHLLKQHSYKSLSQAAQTVLENGLTDQCEIIRAL